MISTAVPNDYWIIRYRQSVQRARNAPTEQLRKALTDLARHYVSMHELINGRRGADAPRPQSDAVSGEAQALGLLNEMLMAAA